MKKFSGSANRQRFLQNDWELHLEDEELRPELQALTDKIEDLQDELLELRQEVSHVHQDLTELAAQKDDAEIELRTTELLLDQSIIRHVYAKFHDWIYLYWINISCFRKVNCYNNIILGM